MPQAQRRLPPLLRLPAGCAARQGQPRGTQDSGFQPPCAPYARRTLQNPAGRDGLYLLHVRFPRRGGRRLARRSVGDDPHTQRPAFFLHHQAYRPPHAGIAARLGRGGYENLAVGCTVENQAMADYRLPFLLDAPLRHKLVICAPLLGPLDIARYLTPGSKRYPSGANRATKPAPAITTGCFRSAASASRQTFPSLSTKPARGLSRTGAFTASAARTSIRRPARPGSTTRQSDEVSPPLSALHEPRHPALVFPHPAPGPLHKAIPAPPSRPVRLRHAVTRSHISPAISLGNRPCPTPRPIPRNRFPRYHASQ